MSHKAFSSIRVAHRLFQCRHCLTSTTALCLDRTSATQSLTLWPGPPSRSDFLLPPASFGQPPTIFSKFGYSSLRAGQHMMLLQHPTSSINFRPSQVTLLLWRLGCRRLNLPLSQAVILMLNSLKMLLCWFRYDLVALTPAYFSIFTLLQALLAATSRREHCFMTHALPAVSVTLCRMLFRL